MIQQLSRLLKAGNYLSTACATMDIDPASYNAWLERGARDEAEGKTEAESVFIRFLHSVKRADAEAEAEIVAKVKAKIDTDRTGITGFTFLDRRWRARWGQTATVNINETKTVTVTHVEVCLPPGSHPAAIEGQVTEVPMLLPATDSNSNSTPEAAHNDS
ncbi:MAG: hypothetical protein WC455_15540 [Dehalococcoidia bacterium]|jgi:hypothetical protein